MIILTVNAGLPWAGHAFVLARDVETMTKAEKRAAIQRMLGVARLDQVDIVGDQVTVKGRAYATITTGKTLPGRLVWTKHTTERARLDAMVAAEGR